MNSQLLPYADRSEAGRVLVGAMKKYAGRRDVLVLGLPRGGVEVAYAVAQSLEAPLDILVVRKLGLPGYEELAMGAIATGGARVLNQDVVQKMRISIDVIETVAASERRELVRREHAYRGNRPMPDMTGRCVILVDDGLATGSTMRAAVSAVRQYEPASVVVAVPVAPPQTIEFLGAEADDVICPATPVSFRAVGQWYVQFSQATDDEVCITLATAWKNQPVSHA